MSSTELSPELVDLVARLSAAAGQRVALTLAVVAEPHARPSREWSVWFDGRRVAGPLPTPERALDAAHQQLSTGASPLRYLRHAPVVLEILREVRGLVRDVAGGEGP